MCLFLFSIIRFSCSQLFVKIVSLLGMFNFKYCCRQIDDLDFKVYTYRGYGREYMKSCRTSPDVYIQLALQYAYYK